jgi:hypothetical protein
MLTRLADVEGTCALMLRRSRPVLLEKPSWHLVPVTAKLRRWVLNFRFGPNGAVQPLLAVVAHGQPDNIF